MTLRGIVLFTAGLISGLFVWNYSLDEPDKPNDIEITISRDTIKVGRAMYWSNDTLWNDENHTQFLKVFPN